MQEGMKTMATITKRKGKYRVQVRKNGTSISETFTLRKDAETWGKQKELEIERGELPCDPKSKLKGLTLHDLVVRYRDTVTPQKKSRKQETSALNKFLRHGICSKALADVATSDFSEYRDERLQTVTAVTLQRELATIHNVYTVASDEWGIPIKENPLDKLALKATPVERERRLREGELDLIIADAKARKNQLILPVILFAIETGMRLSEILGAEWRHLDLKTRTLRIPDAKNGTPRRIPLTRNAIEVLEGLDTDEDHVFPINSSTFKNTWLRMMDRLKIEDLHFHDLRHEGISILFEKGLNVPEVASISGHKDWKKLRIYANPRPADILKKLDGATHVTL
jgi:integrase